MSLSHVVIERVVIGGEEISASNTFNGGYEVAIDESIPVGTDTLVNLVLDVSQVKSIIILSDRDITIETNATNAAGGNTLALKAGIPYRWYQNQYNTMVFTTDVARAYITNASGGSARLQLSAMVDPTV